MQTLYVEPGGLPPFLDHRDFYQTSVILSDGGYYSAQRGRMDSELLICYLFIYIYLSSLKQDRKDFSV